MYKNKISERAVNCRHFIYSLKLTLCIFSILVCSLLVFVSCNNKVLSEMCTVPAAECPEESCGLLYCLSWCRWSHGAAGWSCLPYWWWEYETLGLTLHPAGSGRLLVLLPGQGENQSCGAGTAQRGVHQTHDVAASSEQKVFI